MSLTTSLAQSAEYPGRGLAIGRDSDGIPFFAYWLTGRSPASQSRELVVRDRELVVQDVSGAATDDLRHYTAATRGDDWVLVGNGTQVSELTAIRAQQPDLQVALRRLTYEPDPPIRTPRITAGATISGAELTEVVIGSARAYGELTAHPSLYAARVEAGSALTTTTYSGTADEVVTNGWPEIVAVPLGWSAVAGTVWQSLRPSLRIAVITIRLDTPAFTEVVLRTRT